MKAWLVIVLIAVSALVWVGSGFVSKVALFHRLSHQIEGVATQWGVLTEGEEKYRLFVDYTTEQFSGRHIFKKPPYRTREAAEEALNARKADRVTVWYKGQMATLEHAFPIKEAIQTCVVACLLGYFIFLRRFVSQF